jgi:hypothetical protein
MLVSHLLSPVKSQCHTWLRWWRERSNANLVSLVILDMPRRVASQLLALPNEYGQQTPESLWIPIKPTQSC